jgi:gliding motility-associated-like protein
MMQKCYYIILFALLLFQSGFAQDAAITTGTNPLNGCNLTAAEDVKLIILNNSSLVIPSGSITVKYTVNGSIPIAEVLTTNLSGGATWNFTFNAKANLSNCGAYTLKTWIEYAADINLANDTLVWSVQNDCTVVPGQVVNDELVCHGNNSNTLNFINSQYGSISNWVFSENNGASWNQITNSTSNHTFNNLITDTKFAVAIDGGFCPNDTSSAATITVQPLPFLGTLYGQDSLCASNPTGVVALSGASGSILDWENSTDNGNTWTTSGNNSTLESFSNLSGTTWFRAIIEDGICPNVYSDTFVVHIVEETNAGILETDTLICQDEVVDLTLGTSIGDVSQWEKSADGITWTTILQSNPVFSYNTGVLTNPTHYRVSVKNGICPAELSNSIIVDVQDNPIGGSVAGTDSVCASAANGVIALNGNSGGVIEWSSSIDQGQNWIMFPSTNTVLNYTNLSQSILYRALINGGACPNIYSDTAEITVIDVSNAGSLFADTSICEGEELTLSQININGTIVSWQSSPDFTNWSNINNTDSTFFINSVSVSSHYRVIVKNDICPSDTSNSIFVELLSLPLADAGIDVEITSGESAQLNGSGGQFGIWEPGATLNDSTIYEPLANPLKTTEYTLFVIGNNGCFAADQMSVIVNDPIPAIEITNLLTPNKDGFNDFWFIKGISFYTNTEVEVYNLYGQQVYVNKDYKNNWNGEYKGKRLPDGTYFYFVKIKDEVIKGDLTILGND